MKRSIDKRRMILLILLYWMSLYTFMFYISIKSDELNASSSMIGMITGAYGLVSLILRIPLGLSSDYFKNQKIFILLGICANMLAGFGMFLAKSPAAMLCFSALIGISFSVWSVLISSLMTYYENENYQKGIATANVLISVGQLFGTIIGGLTAQLLNSNLTFLLGAVQGCIAFIIALTIKDTYPNPCTKYRDGKMTGLILRDKKLIFYGLITAISNFIMFAAIYSFAPLLMRNRGASSLEISMITGAYLLGYSITAAFSCGLFSKKLGISATGFIGFFLQGVILILITVSKGVFSLFVFELLIGFAIGVMCPCFMAEGLQNISAEMRSTGAASFQAIYSFGTFSGPVVIGILLRRFSYNNVFLIMAAISFATAALFIMTLCAGKRETKHDPAKHMT